MFTKTGVYTKNRNFRLYKASKVGKNAALTLAEDNKFIAAPVKGMSAEQSVFLASLICNVRYEGHPEPEDSMRWNECVFLSNMSVSAFLLCSFSFTNQRILTWDTSEAKEDKHPKLHIVLDSDSLSGSLWSPHKEVDDFVLTLVKKDGVEGSKLRSNIYFQFLPS